MAALGVDIGGTRIRAMVSESGATLSERSQPASGLTLPLLLDHIGELIATCESRIEAVGIGLPGPVGPDGNVGELVHLRGFRQGPVTGILERELGMPVIVDNDVNFAALAEQRELAEPELAFIAVGTGVGMGVISGGRLIRGARGGAGELGDLPLPGLCGPLRLETIAGGAGLVSRWRRHDPQASRAEQVFSAAAAGDAAAVALIEDQARALAAGIRVVGLLLDPAVFVLGGGIGQRADVVDRVRAALAAAGSSSVEVRPSALAARAGLVGALQAAEGAALGAITTEVTG